MWKIAASPTAPRKDNVGLVLMWKIAFSATLLRDDNDVDSSPSVQNDGGEEGI